MYVHLRAARLYLLTAFVSLAAVFHIDPATNAIAVISTVQPDCKLRLDSA